jgi:hypothetical protein
MIPEPQPEPSVQKWSDDERQQFLTDRTRLLQRLLRNRQSWQDTYERLGGQSTLKITWIDHEDHEQQTLLTEPFLAGYATVMRAVACDLIICGEDGAQIAEQLFADLSGIDGEQDA